MSKILCESQITNGLKLVTESSAINAKQVNPKALGVLEGTCSDFKVPTRNKTVYSKKLWENIVGSDYVKEGLETKTLFGEIDHPEERLDLSMQEAAINCTSLWIDEQQDVLMGTFDILPTEKGRLLKTLCDYGSHIGVSSRGVGDLVQGADGSSVVCEDNYVFVCFDAVVKPSVVKARPSYMALTESEKIQQDKNVETILIENMNVSKTEEELKSVANLAKKLNIYNKNISSIYESQLLLLKTNDKDIIMKKNEVLQKDLTEAYQEINSLKCKNEKNNIASDIDFIRTQNVNIIKALNESQQTFVNNYQVKVSETETLKDTITSLKESNQKAIIKLKAQFQKQIEELDSILTEKEAIINDLTDKVEYATQFVHKCKDTVTSLTESNSNLKSVNSELSAERTKLTESLSEKSASLNALKSKISTSTSSGEDSKRLLESLITEYVQRKQIDFGMPINLNHETLSKINSLKDIDVLITESVKYGKETDMGKSQKLINEQLLKKTLRESTAPTISNTGTENLVLKQIFNQFNQTK